MASGVVMVSSTMVWSVLVLSYDDHATVNVLGALVALCVSGTRFPYDRLYGTVCVEFFRYGFVGRGGSVHANGPYGCACDWMLDSFIFASVVSEDGVTDG